VSGRGHRFVDCVHHFEKMLYDVAQLARVYLHAWQVTDAPFFRTIAEETLDYVMREMTDPVGGFLDTRDDHEELLIRPKDLQDNATPSGNAQAATALLQLAAFTANPEWRDLAEAMFSNMVDPMQRHPTAFAQWLTAADFAVGPIKEIAILGGLDDPQTIALRSILNQSQRPRTVLALSPYPPPKVAPPLLDDRPLKDDQPTAYVCYAPFPGRVSPAYSR
jgi:uncharacterized protein YyaL (SSP411 family)